MTGEYGTTVYYINKEEGLFMRRYIFITADIHLVGGMQMYVAGKTEYLRRQGWSVAMFFYGENHGTCAYHILNDYVGGGLFELSRQPYEWTRRIRVNTINEMESVIKGVATDSEEIIIESQTDITALWGELLAERLNAKHVCLICNEKFRGHNKHYEENLDFFDFKHNRRELAGIHKESLRRMFAGYKEVDEKECFSFSAANNDPIQDIENDKIDTLEKKDWNICYIGRAKKGYVPGIIDDISKFAKKHQEKRIQVIFVGDQSEHLVIINNKLLGQKNVTVSLLGDLVPIPRGLFRKIDVVIAGSGCAYCSAKERVPTIVADADNYLANGVLGYTTFDGIYREKNNRQMHFDEMLEEVLVKHITTKLPYKMDEKPNSDYYYHQQMDFVFRSEQTKCYYKLNKNIPQIGIKDITKYYVMKRFPNVLKKYREIKDECK